MQFEFFQELKHILNDGSDFVLCTVVAAEGSSPAKPGQKMIVCADGSITGTVGGGVNEERVRQAALTLFAKGGSQLLEFSLVASIDEPEPVCGGNCTIFIELLHDRPKLVIFGGGHIGNALARMAQVLRFHVTLVDERPEFVTHERIPGVDRGVCLPYEQAIEQCAIDARTSLVIVTPGHVKDREVLARVIDSPAAYIGMVGSARKWAEMQKAMVAEGVSQARLDQIHCPIGINLVGQSPEEIALGILAQIVAHRHGKPLPFVKY